MTSFVFWSFDHSLANGYLLMNTESPRPGNTKSVFAEVIARFLVLVLLSFSTTATSTATRKIKPEEARTATAEIIQLIESHYVFPEKRQEIANAIRTSAAAHRYETDDPYVFADRITADLRDAGHDRHLGVVFNPSTSKALDQHHNSIAPQPSTRSPGRLRNEGFEELKILPGNVRYVKITNFMWTDDVTAGVIDEVARFLGDGDAVIIDLRGNGGGNANAVARLISYFMKNDDQVLMTFYDGMTGNVVESRVKDDLRAPRMVGKPLYTLIDDGTASAAEEFAYHVQQFRLGSLVGEKTLGAANNNHHFPIEPGFVVSISIGRPIHPVSKANWEGSGIAPTDPVPAAAALEHAQLRALHRLAEKAPEGEKLPYTWAIQAIEALIHPFNVAAPDLEPYAGHYGVRTIRVENGTLVLQRDGRPPTNLTPMAPDLFVLARNNDVRVKFRRVGNRVVGFDQITDDGEVIPSDRDG